MSEIKALEELRESFDDCTQEAGIEPNTFDTVWITKSCAMSMLDAIQAEVDERFMELPVDADGVPIHMGDLVADNREPSKPYKVDRFHVYDDGEWSIGVLGDPPFNLHHVKPRTLEDVLCDFANDVAKQGHQIGLTAHELSDKYAAEIRELLGVDA